MTTAIMTGASASQIIVEMTHRETALAFAALATIFASALITMCPNLDPPQDPLGVLQALGITNANG